MEAIYPILFLGYYFLRQDAGLSLNWATLLFLYFGIVIVIDIEHHLILRPVSIAGAVLGIFFGVRFHGMDATLLGGAGGFLIMLSLYFLGIGFVRIWSRMFQKELSETEGLGFGDVSLGGVIGLLLGWPAVVIGVVMTILLAGAASLLYIIISKASGKYHPNMSLPYGPFLSASTLFLLIYHSIIR